MPFAGSVVSRARPAVHIQLLVGGKVIGAEIQHGLRIRLRIAEGKGPSLRIQRVPGAHVLQHLMRQTLVGLFNAVEQARSDTGC